MIESFFCDTLENWIVFLEVAFFVRFMQYLAWFLLDEYPFHAVLNDVGDIYNGFREYILFSEIYLASQVIGCDVSDFDASEQWFDMIVVCLTIIGS